MGSLMHRLWRSSLRRRAALREVTKAGRSAFVLLIAVVVWVTPAQPQDDVRALYVVRDHSGKDVLKFGSSYALLIGASAYRHWRPLPGVMRDLPELERVFKAHGFMVTVVRDPSADELEAALEAFIREYGRTETNRLLIYYAGHGYTDPVHERDRGYLVPIDAPDPLEDKDGFLDMALPIHRMRGYALDIRTRHAIFLFDSCFSGAIFEDVERAAPDPPASISYVTGKPVRQFISSGSKDQPVSDRSEFRHQLVDALDGKTLLSKDQYVTGTELGSFLFDAVTNYTDSKQTPQSGTLEDGVYDQGDFVFVIPPKPPPHLVDAPVAIGEPGGGATDAEDRRAAAAVAVWPPTLIDIGQEVRFGLGDAIVEELTGEVERVIDPLSVSQMLDQRKLAAIEACGADDLCLLARCGDLDVDLIAATVFEALPGSMYTAEVIVIDVNQCSLANREGVSANQLIVLRARAQKAARNIIREWLK